MHVGKLSGKLWVENYQKSIAQEDDLSVGAYSRQNDDPRTQLKPLKGFRESARHLLDRGSQSDQSAQQLVAPSWQSRGYRRQLPGIDLLLGYLALGLPCHSENPSGT